MEGNFLQHIHYNANKDISINLKDSIKQVLYIYRSKNNSNPCIIELVDDGKHFDNEKNDRIFGNYISGNFNEFRTDEADINIQMDTIGINYNILQNPVNYLPEPPKIIEPFHQSSISSLSPNLCWKIDQNADGCGVILVGNKPVPGEELINIIWEKEFRESNREIFTEKIPVILLNKKEYTLITWSYVNTKLINNTWNAGSYSIEWSTFYTDTLNKASDNNLFLSQNFPNPFNSSTYIKYNLPNKGNVCIKIFDVTGREVTTLINREQPEGVNYVLWNGKNSYGNYAASGIYFYRIVVNNKYMIKKMILTR